MQEKQNVIHDSPMDIVELLSRNKLEERLRTDTNSLGKSHTRPLIAAVDYAKIAAKDGAIDVSTVLDTDF